MSRRPEMRDAQSLLFLLFVEITTTYVCESFGPCHGGEVLSEAKEGPLFYIVCVEIIHVCYDKTPEPTLPRLERSHHTISYIMHACQVRVQYRPILNVPRRGAPVNAPREALLIPHVRVSTGEKKKEKGKERNTKTSSNHIF
jgi:hypothetical protein